jgi:pilus assembly protein CpaF
MANDEQFGMLLQHISRLEDEIKNIKLQQYSGFAPNPQDITYEERYAKSALTEELVRELSDMGIIQPFLADETINDILINGTKSIYIERFGKLECTNVTFPDNSKIMEIAEKIVKAVGRRIDPTRPLVDARLLDGSRVNIIAPPLAVDGTSISIRKFSKRSISLNMMAENNNLSKQLAEVLKIIGKCRLNVIISGGTGSGKTTLLNALSQYIENDERVVTIEDAAELKLQQPHVIRLETKPVTFNNGMREEDVTMRDLVKNALRMRPDRIIVGECRGAEAFDMMQAMNTGHDGSLSTIHANHPRDCLSRIENMMSMANLGIPMRSIRSQIAAAVNIIVQISRMRDGQRRTVYLSEVVGMEGDLITMQDLFTFNVTGEDKNGKLVGDFKWSGIMPRFVRRAAYYGELENLANALGVRIPKL